MKVVNGGKALAFARQVESSKLMAAQRQVAVSPLHIGARALKYRCQPLGLVTELILRLGAQRAEEAARLKQRGTEPLGDFAKRFATLDGTRLGNAIEIIGWNQLGVHGLVNRQRYI